MISVASVRSSGRRANWVTDDWRQNFGLGLGSVLDSEIVIFIVQFTVAQMACRPDAWQSCYLYRENIHFVFVFFSPNLCLSLNILFSFIKLQMSRDTNRIDATCLLQ